MFGWAAIEVFDDWAEEELSKGGHGCYAEPGDYSDGAGVAGYALIGGSLPPELTGQMTDQEAGWG